LRTKWKRIIQWEAFEFVQFM